jgi:hypothetical protein
VFPCFSLPGFEDHWDRASPAIVQATIFWLSITPEIREISRPPCINRRVGMPLIPRRDEQKRLRQFSRGLFYRIC